MRFHRLAPAWFDELLNAPGLTYRIAHRKASLCPCQDPRGSGPDPACPRCGGVGYTWSEVPWRTYTEAVEARPRGEADRKMGGATGKVSRAWATLVEVRHGDEVVPGARLEEDYLVLPEGWPLGNYTVTYQAPEQGRGHIQNMRISRTWADRGEVQTGDLVLTVPRTGPDGPNPGWDAQPGDQVIVLDHRHRAQQRMVRGVKEVLTHPWVREIIEARTPTATYRFGEDFRVEGGRVVWEAGRGPTPRTPYVLEYVAAPTYYVLEDLGHRRHVEGYDLPRRFSLGLFDTYPGRGK